MTTVFQGEEMIAPGVSAYYHLPPVWIGSEPSETEFQNAPVSQLIRDEFKAILYHDIRVRVRRDGLFVFDCSRWEPGCFTEIPAYSVNMGDKIPREVTEAEDRAEQRAAVRTQLMNAHQACLSSAHNAVHHRSVGLGAIVVPSRDVKLIDFNHNNVAGLSTHEPYGRFMSDVLEFTKGNRIEELRNRLVVELDTIEYSYSLLNDLLRSPVSGHIQLVEMLYRAGIQFSESHFAESLIHSWTVCERLIDLLWTSYIGEKTTNENGIRKRVNRERRKKLKGRDFTASILLEILELSGRIPHDLFNKVDDIRRARNYWIHELKEVSASDASWAILTTENLMEHVTGIRIRISCSRLGATRGVPKRYYNPDYSINRVALQREIDRLHRSR